MQQGAARRMRKEPTAPDVSVVIPAFNSAPWLESTLESIRVALGRTSWTAEILVVDDGSNDGTAALIATLAREFPHELRTIEQDNQGVFLAVWHGLVASRAKMVLIFNSRLILHPGALEHLERLGALDSGRTWNGHVITDPESPLVGRFWEVPTHVFWGTYLAHPRPMEINAENFDRVPKGTGCLLVPRATMIAAYEACWPEENARFTSDDTKLLRHISNDRAILLEPGFSATYRPRTTVKRFLAHALNRGTMFVDSYAGTSRLRDVVLLLLATLPPVLVVAAVGATVAGRWKALAGIGALTLAGVTAPAVVGATRRAPARAVMSYFAYILPFGVVFWRGLVRGVIVHRGAFRRRRGAGSPVDGT
jgi:glycosyltransferase involved in cell wall biosynthesis